MKSLQVYLGYDERQPVAVNVLAHSITRRCSVPVSITRLHLPQLPMTRRGLTAFTYSRFLVPHLSNFTGVSVFLDSDMLCLSDLAELLAYPLMDPESDVFVVDHDKKFERPSLMVFNNERCTVLTPQYIEDRSNKLMPLDWAQKVGTLPNAWNHLVGYDALNPDAKVVHFTAGLPVWKETASCEFSETWRKEFTHSNATVSFQALMGHSVHTPLVQSGALQHAGVAY